MTVPEDVARALKDLADATLSQAVAIKGGFKSLEGLLKAEQGARPKIVLPNGNAVLASTIRGVLVHEREVIHENLYTTPGTFVDLEGREGELIETEDQETAERWRDQIISAWKHALGQESP